jgi:hypothetical protein
MTIDLIGSPRSIAFCKPSKHRGALKDVAIIVGSCYAKEGVPNPEIL